MYLTLDKFVEELRPEREYPRQPHRAEIATLYRRGFSVSEATRYFNKRVRQLEAASPEGE